MSHFRADKPDTPHVPEESPDTGLPMGQTSSRQMPRYKVVLHRDSRNDLMFVVRCVMELIRFPRAEATNKMWEAQHHGQTVLLLTYLERAELYVEQFATRNLTVTIERI